MRHPNSSLEAHTIMYLFFDELNELPVAV